MQKGCDGIYRGDDNYKTELYTLSPCFPVNWVYLDVYNICHICIASKSKTRCK